MGNVSEGAAQLLGTWKLVSFVRRVDGEVRTDMLGPNPTGLISYQSDGYMSALLSVTERPWADDDTFLTVSPEIRAMTAAAFSGYGGPFRVEGDRVIHSVIISQWPEHIGTELVRTISWDGDDLILTTVPVLTPSGKSLDDQLRWRRVTAR